MLMAKYSPPRTGGGCKPAPLPNPHTGHIRVTSCAPAHPPWFACSKVAPVPPRHPRSLAAGFAAKPASVRASCEPCSASMLRMWRLANSRYPAYCVLANLAHHPLASEKYKIGGIPTIPTEGGLLMMERRSPYRAQTPYRTQAWREQSSQLYGLLRS